MSQETGSKSFFDLVKDCDSFSYDLPGSEVPIEDRISRFYIKDELVGYLRSTVVSALQRDFSERFSIRPNEAHAFDVCVQGCDQSQNSTEQLSKLLNVIASFWRENNVFAVLQGWRDEQYTIYGTEGSILFTLERAACGLFGLATYGAHLNAYIPATSEEPLKMWCPRRAMTKATYPGMLDNSVAGGISNGMSAYETIIKESDEEASIPENIARKHIKGAGAISYIYVDGSVQHGAGWIQPEVQYVYDLALIGEHADMKLKPNDGESDDFELWPIDLVQEEMRKGHFKPNCAAVIIDFMIRHGLITPENEPDFLRIQQRLHRSFDFPIR